MGFLGSLVAEGGASAITGIDWSTVLANVDFQPLVTGMVSIVGIAIPVLIPLLVIRKGYDFLRGVLYSA